MRAEPPVEDGETVQRPDHEKAGRDPSMFKIAPAVKVIVAETAAQAEEQRALTASPAEGVTG